jgi:arabinogalactan endo-1,4-beta-galactosidase
VADLDAGLYEFTFWYIAGASNTATRQIKINDEIIPISTALSWTKSTTYYNLESPGSIIVSFGGTSNADAGFYVDDVSLKHITAIPQPPAQADIFVTKVENLSEDFTMGADISSLISLENSGVVFRNEDGEPDDLIAILKNAGVNYVRIRVWNDPYYRDEARPSNTGSASYSAYPTLGPDDIGKGYGGGNCDLEVAKAIGKRATDAGLGVLIDFHYSDHWADPGKQDLPKAWKGKTKEQVQGLLYDYTYNSLKYLIEQGVNVGMVQVGNETNSRMAGQTAGTDTYELIVKGFAAIEQVNKDKGVHILKAIHMANPNSVDQRGFARGVQEKVKAYNVANSLTGDDRLDWDVFMTSYYEIWHGTQANLRTKMNEIINDDQINPIGTNPNNAKTQKRVMVAETSYPYTTSSGDTHETTVPSAGRPTNYPINAQGQANSVRDIIALVSGLDNGMGAGVFYWEPAWLPVNQAGIPLPTAELKNGGYGEITKTKLQQDTNFGQNPSATWLENAIKWNQWGSGWASKYSGYYNTDNGNNWGGTAQENQALFDFWGNPLPSLNVFKYVYTGAVADLKVDSIADISFDCLPTTADFDKNLPAKVTVVYTNSTEGMEPVVWDPTELAAARDGLLGIYDITGTVSLGGEDTTFTCTVYKNNILSNPGFETNTIWSRIAGTGSNPTIGGQAGNARSGNCVHWGGTSTYTISQTIPNVEPGYYTFHVWLQGGSPALTSNVTLSINGATVDGTYSYTAQNPNGWGDYRKAMFNNILVADRGDVTVSFKIGGTGWGAFDDAYFGQMKPEDATKKEKPPLVFTYAPTIVTGTTPASLAATSIAGSSDITYSVVSGTSLTADPVTGAITLTGTTGDTTVKATKPKGTLYNNDAEATVTIKVINAIKPITAIDPSDITVLDKAYDGSKRALVEFNLTTASGFDAGDIGDGSFPKKLTAWATAEFNDASVGNGKAVTITDIKLGGTEAYKYELLGKTAAKTANITPATTPISHELYVQKVEGLSQDFIMGADVSAEPALRASGEVNWVDKDGNASSLYKELANAGVNWVRARIWNDPYYRGEKSRRDIDALKTVETDGSHGYGGGTNDLAKAVDIGQRATAEGMRMLVDFHYSDSWADPERQYSPKAWEGMTIDQRSEALFNFTYDSLKQLIEAGVDVGMVQIGNETNNGMAGVGADQMIRLMKKGCEAVDKINLDYGVNIKKAVHFTDPQDGVKQMSRAKALADGGVNYDVYMLSWYPNYHGTLENITQVMNNITHTYGKEVAIAETNYGTGGGMGYYGYPYTVQGQAHIVRDAIAAVNAVEGGKGIGVFYWEPDWPNISASGRLNYGAGWSTYYAANYDSHAPTSGAGASGQSTGSMFSGANSARTPLPSLDVWKLVKTGAVGESDIVVSSIPVESASGAINVVIGKPFTMPATIEVIYTDNARIQENVVWDSSDVAAMENGLSGTYSIKGVVTLGHIAGGTRNVTATVNKVIENMVVNPSFADEPWGTGWTEAPGGTGGALSIGFGGDQGNSNGGDNHCVHWNDAIRNRTITQTFTDVPAGYYTFKVGVQGGIGSNTKVTISATGATLDGTYSNSMGSGGSWGTYRWLTVSNILVAAQGDVTININITCTSASSSWGALDDAYFAMMDTDITQKDAPTITGLTDKTLAIDADPFTLTGTSTAGAITYEAVSGDSVTVSASGLVTVVKAGDTVIRGTASKGNLYKNDGIKEITIHVKDDTYTADVGPTRWTFAAKAPGYTPEVKEFTITNTGSGQITGLDVSLGGTNFIISTTPVGATLNFGEAATVSISPEAGLPEGAYADTLTIRWDNDGGGLTAALSFTVSDTPITAAEISPESWAFPEATEGYGAQAAKVFTIRNIGTETIIGLDVSLGGTDFIISTTPVGATLNPGETATVSVGPKIGLEPGNYTDTLTVTDGNSITTTVGLSFTVNEVSQPATYAVTVGGSYATGGTGAGNYAQGDTVTIHAGSRGGYTFNRWTSSDGIVFANANSATTTFTMPAKPVTVTATWTSNSSDDTGSSSNDTTVPPPTPEAPKTVTGPSTKEVTAAPPTEPQKDKAVKAVEALAEKKSQNGSVKIAPAGDPVNIQTGTDTLTVVTVKPPENLKTDGITTMAILNEDGSLTPVPTRIDENGNLIVLVSGNVTLVPLKVEANFTDINLGSQNQHVIEEINRAAALMIVEGIGNNLYAPAAVVTVQQTVTMFLRAMGVPVNWNTAMETGKSHGLATSNENQTGPMTRIATATLMVHAMQDLGMNPVMTASEANEVLKGFTDLGNLTAQQKIELAICVKLNLFQGFGNGTVGPLADLQRSQMASLAVRFQDMIFGEKAK